MTTRQARGGVRRNGLLLGMLALLSVVAVQLWRSDARPIQDRESARLDPPARQRAHQLSAPTALPSAAWSISGNVRNERGGAIENARVCAVCSTCDATLGLATVCTATAASGAYTLQLADERSVMLSASARGFRLGHAHAGRPIQRDAAGANTDIVLADDGARLAGTVMDALGGPVADARVQLWRVAGALQSLVETRSDSDGKFELWAAPGSASIRAEAPGYAATSRGVVAPSADIALQLTPAGTISGTVVERATGKPVADVEVRALFEGIRGRSFAAVSGYDGRFSVTGLEPGRYLVSAEHERFRAESAITVQLGLAQVVKSLSVPLVPAVTVHGRLVSQSGDAREACLGGRVTLDPTGVSQPEGASPSASLSAVEPDGTVHLRGLTRGRYRVDVRCADEALTETAAPLEVHDQDVRVTWQIERGLGLEISVLDGANQPVPHAALVMQRTSVERAGATIFTPLSADEHGHASTGTHLLPGSYTIKPGAGLLGDSVTVDLRPGSGTSHLTVRVRGSAWLQVDVRDQRGQPVDGLRLNARAATSAGSGKAAPLAPAKPLGAGIYRMGPLEAGRYSVHAADGVNRTWGDAAEHALITVPSDGLVRTTLQIERGGRVAGHVLDVQGQPAANVWVSIQDETVKVDPLQRLARAQLAQRRLSDVDGRFELDGLSAQGRYVISVNDPEAGTGSLHDVQAGATVRIALQHPTPIARSKGGR